MEGRIEVENEGPEHRQGQRGRVPQPGPAAGRRQGEAGRTDGALPGHDRGRKAL